MDTTYDNKLGMLHNVAVEIEEKTQVLAVGALAAAGAVEVVDYDKLTEKAATPSTTITFGTPDDGDTIIISNLPTDGNKVFTKVAATPGADEFSSIAELTALIDALTDLGASDDGTTITITVATAGTGMNSATITGSGTFSALAITFSGGQNHATLTVTDADGTAHVLTEGTDFTSETSNAITAESLKDAIHALTSVNATRDDQTVNIVAASVGYSGKLIGLATSDAVNLTISGATLTLAESGYIFTGKLTPAPILNSAGSAQAKPSFTGSTFVTEVDFENLVVSQGQYWIDYRTGAYKVYTPDGQSGSITATWNVAKMKIDATLETGDIEIGAVEIKDGDTDARANVKAANTARSTATVVVATQSIDAAGAVLSTSALATQATLAALLAKIDLKVIAEGEITVTTAGTPVAAPSNASAKAVLVMNNNKDGKEIAVGLNASVDANSTPQIGRVLGALDSTVIYVSANSNEVYVDATADGSKASYQILG